MADEGSLLSFRARRHTVGREDVATDALSFILVPLELRQTGAFRPPGGRPRALAGRGSAAVGGGCPWSYTRSGMLRRG